MTPDDIKARYRLSVEMGKLGVELRGSGNSTFMALCPFHDDKNPSLSIDDNKRVFFCHGCKATGSVIDFWARKRGVHPNEVIKELCDQPIPAPATNGAAKSHRIDKIYTYRDQTGRDVYEVVRYEPKTFKQRHPGPDGKMIWGMDGVTRVLYRLPEIMAAKQVWVCEGEKDADNLAMLGYEATCNVGGAGKWMDGYTESLADKEIVICGDSDDAGRDHVNLIFKSIAGRVKNTRQITLPKPHKDISDFIYSFRGDSAKAKEAVDGLLLAAPVLVKGINLPIYSLAEIEPRYERHLRDIKNTELSLGRWLPSLGGTRGLIPGELVTICCDTGVGKTMCLSSIAMVARPLKTVLFEMELPEELLFERFVSAYSRFEYPDIVEAYANGSPLGEEGLQPLDHIFCCTESSLTLEDIERYIDRAELKIGERPKLVLIDYVQLIQGKSSSRRERFSDIAEGMKVLAKKTKTIIIIASQVARKEEGEVEVYLHDAKETGSIENSSGLVLGAWRDPKDSMKLYVKVLKNTKGKAGQIIPCTFRKSNKGGFTPKIVELSATIV